jgi:RHS repeat-associated protein
LTDQTRDVVWQASYLPFGEVRTITGPAALDYRFPGQWFQLETGLHYNWHRHYDPSIGRYLQPDPIGMPDGPSRYAYVGNSPLMFVDPEGLQMAVPVPLLAPCVMTTIGAAICACIIGGGAYLLSPSGDPVEEPGLFPPSPVPNPPILNNDDAGGSEHTKGARPSTQGKHEAGQARKGRDRGGEKADKERREPRKRPPGRKGPWPPRD